MIAKEKILKGFETAEARWARFGPYYAMFPLDFAFDVVEKYQDKITKTYVFNAFKEAEKLGNPRAMNIVLLGAIVKCLSLEDIDWKKTIEESVHEKHLKLNLKAFAAGYEISVV